MNPNQPNPQMPSNPVPDHRFEELAERLRTMELQNTQLRTTIDMLKQQPQPGQQQPAQAPLFKPEVQEAIMQTVKQVVDPITQQYRQQIGFLADQLDQTKFNATYGGEKYAKLIPKVEQLREREQAMGRYITREQALQIVHFEETGKKSMTPDPAPQQQQAPEPKFDPYLGTYVGPDGRPAPAPVAAPEQQAPQQMQQQYQQPPQQFQQQPQYQQQPQQWAPGAKPPVQQQGQMGNPYGQNFGLPGQGMNNASNTGVPMTQRGPLSIDSTDADLKAFEEKFGDIPL